MQSTQLKHAYNIYIIYHRRRYSQNETHEEVIFIQIGFILCSEVCELCHFCFLRQNRNGYRQDARNFRFAILWKWTVCALSNGLVFCPFRIEDLRRWGFLMFFNVLTLVVQWLNVRNINSWNRKRSVTIVLCRLTPVMECVSVVDHLRKTLKSRFLKMMIFRKGCNR